MPQNKYKEGESGVIWEWMMRQEHAAATYFKTKLDALVTSFNTKHMPHAKHMPRRVEE